MTILANEIEKFLKKLLEENAVLELQRTELAEIFTCVPSQINYVLETRFSEHQGYHVESRRGGGGYIRIVKLAPMQSADLLQLIDKAKDKSFSQFAGYSMINRLMEEGLLSERESRIIKAMLSDYTLYGADDRDLLRGRMLRTVLVNLLRSDIENG